MVSAVTDKRFAPGFYDEGSGSQRHGEGQDWMSQTRPTPPAPPEPTRRPSATAGSRPLAWLERTSAKQRFAFVGGAVALAFVVGTAVGSGAHRSDVAAAAGTSAPTSDRLTSRETTSPPPTEPSRATEASAVEQQPVSPAAEGRRESAVDPDATTRGLGRTDARLTCQRFGKAAFPYGFEDHSILGVINEEIVRNRWFIKHEATITNGFNAERDTVYECTVGGTPKSPRVTDFSVSR